MKLLNIINNSRQPELYQNGTNFMWTDEYISKQLLNIHLNPELDLASRKKTTIGKSVKWILEQVESNRKLNILDLGCGPGLYSKLLAEKGHKVDGIDISKTSIDYANRTLDDQGLELNYQCANYLEVDFESEAYDLVILIYTDFGVLTPNERETLLKSIHKTLKKGGKLILDVLSDDNISSKVAPKSWEAAESGFWKETPYLSLSESFLFEDEKVIMYQHQIIDENSIEIYRFWTHFFSESVLRQLYSESGFSKFAFHRDVIPAGDPWSGDNVIFSIVTK